MKVKVEDHCQTAADVRAANRRVRDLRRKGREAPPPAAKAPAPPPAAPAMFAVPRPPTFSAGIGHAYLPYTLVQLGEGRRVSLRVTDVLAAVSAFTGVSVIDIKSHRRSSDVVIPRHLVMALARRLTLRSLPEIGRMLGGRDHTTVLHAHQKYKPLLDQLALVIGENASLDEWIAQSWKIVSDHKRRPRARSLEQVAA
jgi:Bacterial dnaA protein helix-turn-helix